MSPTSTNTGVLDAPAFINEPAMEYAPGSADFRRLQQRLREFEAACPDLPLCINGRDVWTRERVPAIVPHRKDHVLAQVHQAGVAEVASAIDAAGSAWNEWQTTPWQDRAAVFLKAASLAVGEWRETLNAATMLGQSKTVYEADADAACELADFFRINVAVSRQVHEQQPVSDELAWNRIDYRALEGFVYAVTPFNFTAIACNLPCSAALMGNTVVWKPSAAAAVSAYQVMELLKAAGLPDGVVNLIHGDPAAVSSQVLASPDLAGIHFTGSSAVLRSLWREVGNNIDRYKSYPRIVGETGGKDFVLAHRSARVEEIVSAVVRGGFEYQGQKCSAASRLFVPKSMWPELSEALVEEIKTIEVGDVSDPSVYMGAVITADSFARQAAALEEARQDPHARILAGGGADDSVGYFVQPTLIESTDPEFRLLRDELFGPVVTAYAYPDDQFQDVLSLIDQGSSYALTGSIFGADRGAVADAAASLRYAAGNLYVNDKPTGAIVGQQPFGGARASGTNDKAGSIWHLSRWASPRTIKDRYVAPRDLPHRELPASEVAQQAAKAS